MRRVRNCDHFISFVSPESATIIRCDMSLLKTLTGKVAGGAVTLAVVIAGISWWRLDTTARAVLMDGAGKLTAWSGVVLLLPWVTFALIARVARQDSNALGATLVLGYTLVEVVLLAWLFGWSLPGASAWTWFAVGGLFAAAYNLFICDWIAEKVE